MKTLQSTVAFQGPTGTVAANGFLALTLAQNCEIIAGGGIVYANIPVFIALDATGKISGSPTIWANDELTPSTSYSVQLQDSNHSNLGNIGPWNISGASPIDVSQIVPQTVTPSFSNAVLQTPAAAQTISGFGLTLASSAPLTVQSSISNADGVSPATPTYTFSSSTNSGFFQYAGGNIGVSTTGVGRMQWIGTGTFMAAGLPFGWESGALNSSVDTGFSRTAAATVALGNGTQGDTSGTLKLSALSSGVTIPSPVITGTPTGSGIPTATLKKGSGGGNYTTTSTTYVVVDSTNLCQTVTIPTGWKLIVNVSASIGTNTGAVAAFLALTDNAACGTANSGILQETSDVQSAAGNTGGVSLSYVITGDGASHSVALQFKTSNGADAAVINNSNATSTVTMTSLLTPSN